MVDFPAQRLLRRHVIDRTHHHAGTCLTRVASSLFEVLSVTPAGDENFAKRKSSTLTRPRELITMFEI
jgi:hypothetical protein